MPTLRVDPGSDEELQDVANALLKARKVVVITGAGISTNSGIPDFRSENGLYSLIQAKFDAAASARQNLQQDTPSQTDSDAESCSHDEDNERTDERAPKRRRLSQKDSIEVHADDVEEPSSEPVEPRPDSITVCPSPKASGSDAPPELPSGPIEVKPETIVCTPQPVRQAIHVAVAMSSSPLSSPPVEDFLIPSSAFRPRSPPSSLPQRRTTRSRVAELSLPPSSSPLSSPPPLCYEPYPAQPLSDSSPSRRSSTSQSDLEDSLAMNLFESSQGHSAGRSSLPNMKGKDLFDASIWSDPLRTSVFYTFATSLRQKIRDCEPTTSHRFISHLRDRGKLVRCYTQNIDRIEEKVGLSTSLQDGPGSKGRFSRRSTATLNQLSKMVDEVTDNRGSSGPSGSQSASQSQSEDGTGTPADLESSQTDPPTKTIKTEPSRMSGVECVFLHGSLECLRCFRCGLNTTWDNGREMETMSGHQPECPHCIGATVAREERGKRALGVGKLRPDIVLYGEEHPNAHLIGPIVTHDISLCPDLLLILGTSLRVHGLKVMVREFANAIHNRGGKVVFVNFTKPPESSWGDFIDYWVQWDCDAWVDDLQNRVPKLWDVSEPPPKEKPPAKNPVAMRDSRANGAWANKKILDELSRITGARDLLRDSPEPDGQKATKSSKRPEKRLSTEGTIQVQTTDEPDEDPPKEAIIVMEETKIVASATSDPCVVEATIEVSQKQTVAQKATRPRRARKSAPAALERGKKKPSSTLNPNHGRASKPVAAQDTILHDMIPQDPLPQDPMPQDSMPLDTARQVTPPQGADPQETVQQETMPQDVVPPITAPLEAGLQDSTSPDTNQDATLPQSVPQEATPQALVPREFIFLEPMLQIPALQDPTPQSDGPMFSPIEAPSSAPPLRRTRAVVGSILHSVKDNPRIRKRKRIYGDEEAQLSTPTPKPAPKPASTRGTSTSSQPVPPEAPTTSAPSEVPPASETPRSSPGPPKKIPKVRGRRPGRRKTEKRKSPSPEMSHPPPQHMQVPPPLFIDQPPTPMQSLQSLQSMHTLILPRPEPVPPPMEPLTPPPGPCIEFGQDVSRISANLQREIDDGRRVAQMHLEDMDRKFRWRPLYSPQDGQTAGLAPVTASVSLPPELTPAAHLPPLPAPPAPTLQQAQPPQHELQPLAPMPMRVVDEKDNEAAMSMVQLRWHQIKDTVTGLLPIRR